MEGKVMTRRGRKPTGPQLVEHLEGSEHAKARLKVILETVAGQRTIPDACAALGIQMSMFHKLRGEVLQTALSRLEPRPLGRPPRQPSAEEQRAAKLEEENLHLQVELRAAEIRGELADALPRLNRPAISPGKKTTPRQPRPKKSRRKQRSKQSNR
jgi:hypothetical protein